MQKFFLGAVLILVVGGGAYLVFSKAFAPQSSTTSPLASDWRTYDGGTWTIQYPKSLTPVNKTANHPSLPTLISFEGLKNGDFIGVHPDTLTGGAIGKAILQRDPGRSDVLSTLLKIQEESGGDGIRIVSSGKINLNNLAAAQFIYTDTSDPSHPSYIISTTLNKGDDLPLISYITTSTQPDPETQQIYNAMLLTFSFK